MLLNDIKASPHLSDLVRLYRIIDFSFSTNDPIPSKPYSPRPEHCIQFYPRDTETVSYNDTDLVVEGKRTSLVGQHTILQHRQVGREFLTIQVVFYPGALFMLTGIPMQEVTNKYIDATDIFGAQVSEVNEQLFHATSYREMIMIVENFISKLRAGIKISAHQVALSAKLMLLQDDRFGVDYFIKEACLSHRQFDRIFTQTIGIPPKQFLRIVRFDRAYRLKNRMPNTDWLTIAIHTGYHDYQHLVKDFQDFTGYTPPQFFVLDTQAPERAFGFAET